MTRLVIGCGYLGFRVARRWVAAGHTVWAVTRDTERAEQFEREGLRPALGDVTSLTRLPEAETVLYAVGYDPQGTATRRQVYVDGLRRVLDALSPRVVRILYISSTGVFGEAGGAWVDEDSPCQPVREAGQVLLAAEQLLRSHPLGARAVILRLAGIYGPGRALRMNDLVAGKPIAVPIGGSLNLIHVDDAVEAILAAELRAHPPRTYLVSDGHPTSVRDFYLHLAELLGLEKPNLVELHPEVARRQRGGADKRVRNTRLMNELGLRLRYPTYREGLAAIVGKEAEDRG